MKTFVVEHRKLPAKYPPRPSRYDAIETEQQPRLDTPHPTPAPSAPVKSHNAIVEVPPSVRKRLDSELEAALAAARAVPAEPLKTLRLRRALAIANAAPSWSEHELWNVWKDEPAKAKFANAVRFALAGARLYRFIDMWERSVEIFEERAAACPPADEGQSHV